MLARCVEARRRQVLFRVLTTQRLVERPAQTQLTENDLSAENSHGETKVLNFFRRLALIRLPGGDAWWGLSAAASAGAS